MDHFGQFMLTEAALWSANRLQVFSPIALGIAYFSMPELPFKPRPSVFFISCPLVIIFVRLLFDVLRGNVHETWWWKGVTWLLNFSHSSHETSPTRKKFGSGLLRNLWGRRPRPDPSLEGTELVVIGV